MVANILGARDLESRPYKLFDTEIIALRPRYQEHSREVFNATPGAAVVEEEWLMPFLKRVLRSQLPITRWVG